VRIVKPGWDDYGDGNQIGIVLAMDPPEGPDNPGAAWVKIIEDLADVGGGPVFRYISCDVEDLESA